MRTNLLINRQTRELFNGKIKLLRNNVLNIWQQWISHLRLLPNIRRAWYDLYGDRSTMRTPIIVQRVWVPSYNQQKI